MVAHMMQDRVQQWRTWKLGACQMGILTGRTVSGQLVGVDWGLESLILLRLTVQYDHELKHIIGVRG